MKWVIISALVTLVLGFLLFFLGRSKNQNVQNAPMKITSTAFENNQPIPALYTCDGQNVNPPLSFSGVPDNTQSLVLLMDDPDAPMGTFDHWVFYNISKDLHGINEAISPKAPSQGKNGAGKVGYTGPCPPSGVHHYHFKLYALSTILDFAAPPTKKEVEDIMANNIIEQAELIGTYSRRK